MKIKISDIETIDNDNGLGEVTLTTKKGEQFVLYARFNKFCSDPVRMHLAPKHSSKECSQFD